MSELEVLVVGDNCEPSRHTLHNIERATPPAGIAEKPFWTCIDPRSSVSLSEFRARARAAAESKSLELGWLSELQAKASALAPGDASSG